MSAGEPSARQIGLWGATATLIGFVIGVSVFLLPGQLAGTAGPAVILAYAIASIVGILSCVVAAQLGAVFPVTGASFVCVARLLGPAFGFAHVWLTVIGVSVAIALVAYGFADYLSLLFPGVDRVSVAMGVVVALAVVNMFGAKLTTGVQAAMVFLMVVVLAVFCGVGIAKMDVSLLTPFVPNGFESVLAAAVPAFFSYAGFMMIVELGAEIKSPGRNIPIALLISFLAVWLAYTGISLVLVGTIPWQELAALPAPVGDVAAIILPPWAADWIVVTVLLAAATSINGLLLGYTRHIVALARSGMFPAAFGRGKGQQNTPVSSILLLTLIALIATSAGGSIAEYATSVVMVLMLGQGLAAVAVMRIPNSLPERYAGARFRLPKALITVFCCFSVAASLAFIVIGVLSSARVVALTIAVIATGSLVYAWRRAVVKEQGEDMIRQARHRLSTIIE